MVTRTQGGPLTTGIFCWKHRQALTIPAAMENAMKRLIVTLSALATAAIPAVLLPAIARSQESAGSDEGLSGLCWGYGRDPGMMGPSYRAGMWERAERGGAYGMVRRANVLAPIWKLDLSGAERMQVSKIANDLRRGRSATMGKLRAARERLREVESVPEPDPKKVGAAYVEVSRLQQEMLEATVQARNQVRAILTPAQRRQFDDWRDLGWGAPATSRGGMASD